MQQRHARADPPRRARRRQRRVELDVTVDGVGAAALGVMSQGELNALALSLFIPRATLAGEPVPLRRHRRSRPVDGPRARGRPRARPAEGGGHAPGRRVHPRRPPGRGRAAAGDPRHRHRGHAPRELGGRAAPRQGSRLAIHRRRAGGREDRRPARPGRAARGPRPLPLGGRGRLHGSRPPPPPGRARPTPRSRTRCGSLRGTKDWAAVALVRHARARRRRAGAPQQAEPGSRRHVQAHQLGRARGADRSRRSTSSAPPRSSPAG